jgi:hypothetical protein
LLAKVCDLINNTTAISVKNCKIGKKKVPINWDFISEKLQNYFFVVSTAGAAVVSTTATVVSTAGVSSTTAVSSVAVSSLCLQAWNPTNKVAAANNTNNFFILVYFYCHKDKAIILFKKSCSLS